MQTRPLCAKCTALRPKPIPLFVHIVQNAVKTPSMVKNGSKNLFGKVHKKIFYFCIYCQMLFSFFCDIILLEVEKRAVRQDRPRGASVPKVDFKKIKHRKGRKKHGY